jgi:hypothetical protein
MLHLFAVAVVYAGLIGMALGAASIVKPLRFAGVRTRGAGAAIAGAAAIVTAAGVLIPSPLERVTDVRTDLDRAMPAWQFRERHRIHVDARPEEVYRAMFAVTAGEIALLRLLTWIRAPHFSARPESIMNPPADKPILDMAMRTSFMRLSERPPSELVMGTLVAGRVRPLGREPTLADFVALNAPGIAKAAVNFLIEPSEGGGSDLATETRVFATDARTVRIFTGYWRVIYPGSALIRIMWLRAIKARAEGRKGQVGGVAP